MNNEKEEVVSEELGTEPEVHEEVHDEKKKHHKDKHLEKIHKLEAKIEELEAEKVLLKNDYFKAYADAQNFKKRNQIEHENNKKYRIQSFAVDILPAIDNLERSVAAMEDKESPIAKGIIMTYNQLWSSLQKEGVEEIDALNKPFDGNFHQALMAEKVEGVESNIVIEVLQKGYILKDRLLRPALVKVSE
jgi:molecular chaperone GrpE